MAASKALTMSCRGDFQNQLSQILTSAKAQGQKFEDIIPSEMLAHFQEMKELTSARKYITEADARITTLETNLDEARRTIRTKQDEIDNLPADMLALKVDLQQAHRSSEYYHDLAETAQTRAERYQARLIESEKKFLDQENQARHIARLEEALSQQTTLVKRLGKENTQLEAHYKTIIATHNDILTSKNTEIENLSEELNQEIEQLRKDNATNAEIADIHDSLINAIESTSAESASTLNQQSIHLQQNDKFSASLISVVQPLVYHLTDTSRVVALYRSIFHSLADPNRLISTDLPPALDDLLDSANDKLRDYSQMLESLGGEIDSDDPARHRLCEQIDCMARSAGLTNVYLEDIKVDFEGFLDRLKDDNETGLAFKGQGRFSSISKRWSMFGGEVSGKAGVKGPRGLAISMAGSVNSSRRSSISTLALGGWSPRSLVSMSMSVLDEKDVGLGTVEVDVVDDL